VVVNICRLTLRVGRGLPRLDYGLWLGPAPEAAYTAARCHFNFRWINDCAPGYITDWGAHLENFGSDEAANALLARPLRGPWKLAV